jgi:hypothetical protein
MNSDLCKLAYCSRSEIRGTGKEVASSILGFSGKASILLGDANPQIGRMLSSNRDPGDSSSIPSGEGLQEVERGGRSLHGVMWLGIG